jgi:hypothetical protein
VVEVDGMGGGASPDVVRLPGVCVRGASVIYFGILYLFAVLLARIGPNWRLLLPQSELDLVYITCMLHGNGPTFFPSFYSKQRHVRQEDHVESTLAQR